MIYPHNTNIQVTWNWRTEKCSISQQPWAYYRKTHEAKQISKCSCMMEALREVKPQNPTMEFLPTLLVLSMTKFVNSSSALLSTSSSQMACRTHALSAWFEEFLISSIWPSTLFIRLKHLMSSMWRYKSLMTTNKFSSILVFAMVLTSQKVISLIITDIWSSYMEWLIISIMITPSTFILILHKMPIAQPTWRMSTHKWLLGWTAWNASLCMINIFNSTFCYCIW